MSKIEDSKTFQDTWCDPECPHLIEPRDADGKYDYSQPYRCAKLGELDYYDFALAKCMYDEKP